MKRGWTEIPFLELVEDTTRLATKIPQAEYERAGRYPIYDQGAVDVAGFTGNETATYRGPVPVILFGDHTRVVKYASEPFVLGADGVKVLTPRPGVDPRFAYHAIRHVDVPAAGYSRHFKFLKEARVPRPPLDEQRRIAMLLDHVGTVRSEALRHLDQLEALFAALQARAFAGELNIDSIDLPPA